VSTVSKGTTEWAELAGEALAAVLGVLLIALGWEEFGWMLAVIGVLGFVVTSVRMRRGRPRPGVASAD
jgi:predicted MFS family arabinose efflux permease